MQAHTLRAGQAERIKRGIRNSQLTAGRLHEACALTPNSGNEGQLSAGRKGVTDSASAAGAHEHHRMSAMLSVIWARSWITSLPEMQAAICTG